MILQSVRQNKILVSKAAGDDPECLTLFEGGRQADFVIHSLNHFKQIVENKIVPNNFNRGVKVIVDKDHVAKNILPKCFGAPHGTAVSEDMFRQSVTMFWFVALYTAKQILRNELWVAKVRDGDLKKLLLQMIEWNEKAVNGDEYDTWHAGRFLLEWTSEDTRAELRSSFGHFDRSDSWKALLSTIALYKRLSHELSQTMGFVCPLDLENHVSNWINQNSNLIL